MANKFFVSYKYKDSNVQSDPVQEYTPSGDTDYLHTPRHYVDKIIDIVGADNIYKGEKGDEDMGHLSDDTIDSKLKEKIFDSSVTIVLVSPNMWDKTKPEKDQWIPNEIAYSLRQKTRGERTSGTNAMLAVVLPDRNGSYSYIVNSYSCVTQWSTASLFKILKENMFNRNEKNLILCTTCGGRHHTGQDHSYVYPVKWADFISNTQAYLNHVIGLRENLEHYEIDKEIV
jgi:hypothetical protein